MHSPNPSATSWIALPPSTFNDAPKFPDAGEYIRVQLNIPRGAPVDLWSVPDPADWEKPNMPMKYLMRLAIYGSAEKKLTLQGIYAELIDRFRWFKENQAVMAWKNSIRHNLSLYDGFVKVERSVYDVGKGSYWELDISRGEATRVRKRRRTAATNTASHSGGRDTQDHLRPRQGTPRDLPKEHIRRRKYQMTNTTHSRNGTARRDDNESDDTSSDFGQSIFDAALLDSRSPSISSPPTSVSSLSTFVSRTAPATSSSQNRLTTSKTVPTVDAANKASSRSAYLLESSVMPPASRSAKVYVTKGRRALPA
ncbi:hypothetical protein DFH09DRAFT_911070 [Mycena vulgaris]|nr:hypothetical protein DFH09DRAFT_911070 [Mycena vulgaris]